MGWAKYEEDNREAMEERWAMRAEYRTATAYSNDRSWYKLNVAKYNANSNRYEKCANYSNNYRYGR